MHVLSDMKL